MDEYICYFDGACLPINPGGHVGFGAYIVDKQTGKTIKEMSGYREPKPQNSNNIAEYLAIKLILDFFKENEMFDCKLTIYGDSKLVINQMSGRWGMSGGFYMDVAKEVLGMMPLFKNIKLSWIPREENGMADELSRASLPEDVRDSQVNNFKKKSSTKARKQLISN